MSFTIHLVQEADELELAFDVRRTVFIEEQQVPEEIELDKYDHDEETKHLLALDETNRAVGTARFRPYAKGTAKIERVAVLAQSRGTGLGRLLMEEVEKEANKAGFQNLRLNAQIQAQAFYEKLGYRAEGDIFLEAEIEHIAMKKSLT